jgi:hypothetical protein
LRPNKRHMNYINDVSEKECGMRKLDKAFVAAALTSLAILVGVSSCEESVKTEQPKPTKKLIENTLQTSQWNVTYLFTDHDASTELIGYTFIFQGDGSLQVIRNDEALTGAWSSYQSTQQQLKLNMEFKTTDGNFRSLTQDWVVVEQTENKIRLRHSTGLNVQPSELTLERV